MSRQMERMRQILVIWAIQQQNIRNRRKHKTMWVYPRPQFCFEQLHLNRYQDHLWLEHFRVSRDTIKHIWGLVGPQLMRQITILREAMVSHAPLFLLLLIGKLSLHISRRNLVSASDQLGHRFRLTDPSVGLFSLLLPVLVEDAAEGDVLRRDVAGINCRVFVLKSGYCGFCITPS